METGNTKREKEKVNRKHGLKKGERWNIWNVCIINSIMEWYQMRIIIIVRIYNRYFAFLRTLFRFLRVQVFLVHSVKTIFNSQFFNPGSPSNTKVREVFTSLSRGVNLPPPYLAGMFVVCLFVDEETNWRYSFSNGLIGHIHLYL
jgi:hypothetical protein